MSTRGADIAAQMEAVADKLDAIHPMINQARRGRDYTTARQAATGMLANMRDHLEAVDYKKIPKKNVVYFMASRLMDAVIKAKAAITDTRNYINHGEVYDDLIYWHFDEAILQVKKAPSMAMVIKALAEAPDFQ